VTIPGARVAAALADRYRVERELGQGGMATVYLAEDRKQRCQVAIRWHGALERCGGLDLTD